MYTIPRFFFNRQSRFGLCSSQFFLPLPPNFDLTRFDLYPIIQNYFSVLSFIHGLTLIHQADQMLQYAVNENPLLTERISALKNAVQEFPPGICTERAVIWTRYFKNRANRKKPACIQIAEALQTVLLNKTVKIYPHELIVGNFTAKRVGGEILPELLGVPVMEDIFTYSRRKTSPLQISGRETWQLLSILPFWAFRFLAIKAHKSPVKKAWKLISQLRSHFYVMNETGGIAHTIPDHEKLITKGTNVSSRKLPSIRSRRSLT